jgi:hypothetical protein
MHAGVRVIVRACVRACVRMRRRITVAAVSGIAYTLA